MLKAMLALVAIVAGSAAAHAQARDNYPVCLRVFGPLNYEECRYTSIPQCKATASGRAAECFVNPFFASAAEPRGRRHRRHQDY